MNEIKEQDIFQLKKKQNSQFLNKIYQLDNLLTRKRKENSGRRPAIKIYIRKRFKDDKLIAPPSFEKRKNYIDMIEMYDGLYQAEFEKMMEELQAKSVKGAESTI